MRNQVVPAVMLMLFGALMTTVFAQTFGPRPLDKEGQKWVESTLKEMTLDEKIGQLLIPTTTGEFTAVDSEQFAKIKEDKDFA